MGTEPEALLAPLPPNGAGEDPRLDTSPGSLYWQLRDRRAEARGAERHRDDHGYELQDSLPAWRDVERLATACLAERGKDFEVALWLMEAWLRLQGLPGIAAGARLVQGLAARYWAQGFPQPEPGEVLEDERDRLFGNMMGGHHSLYSSDGKLVQPLMLLPLFRRPDGSVVTLHDWAIAQDDARLADFQREHRQSIRSLPPLDVLKEEALADLAHLQQRAEEAAQVIEAWRAMMDELVAWAGFAPSDWAMRDALDRIRRVAEEVTMLRWAADQQGA